MSAKPSTGLMVWNIVSVNIGWFACVLTAAAGRPWFGIAAVAVLVAVHLALMPARRREVLTLLATGAIGYALDSLGVLAGAFGFPPEALLGGPSPLWMVALWFNFAVCINVALYWLSGRYLLAAALGALGGPAAYLGGMQFGGMVAPSGLAWLLGVVALEWLLAMPLVIAVAERIGDAVAQPVPARATG